MDESKLYELIGRLYTDNYNLHRGLSNLDAELKDTKEKLGRVLQEYAKLQQSPTNTPNTEQ